MAKFKPKPYISVGTKDWRVIIPRPPKHATHARMSCIDSFGSRDTPKVATLPIQDFGCFRGVSGDFSYIRMDKGRRLLEEYEGEWHWDGKEVEGVEKL